MEPFEPQSLGMQTAPTGWDPVPEPRPEAAGFWRRAAAYLADLFLIQLVVNFLMYVRFLAVVIASAHERGSGFMEFLEDEPLGLSLFIGILSFVLYFTFFTNWGGQTPGKMLMRVRVVAADLEEVSLARSLSRTLCYFASYLFFGLGFLIAAFNRDKRALHDLVAGTRVIRV
jgi:uncharacterized RDD family membrane protein YckC